MYQREVVVLTQYQENYGFNEGKQAWKNKGGHEFRFNIDFDLMMYSKESVIEAVKEILEEQSNDLVRFTFLSIDLAETATKLDGSVIEGRAKIILDEKVSKLAESISNDSI